MVTATLGAFERPETDTAQADTAPAPIVLGGGPVLIGDAVTPLAGCTLLGLLMRATQPDAPDPES